MSKRAFQQTRQYTNNIETHLYRAKIQESKQQEPILIIPNIFKSPLLRPKDSLGGEDLGEVLLQINIQQTFGKININLTAFYVNTFNGLYVEREQYFAVIITYRCNVLLG